ncbi:MAG: cache domain-containing protein [Bryobacterales bacterium]|nr:cache domain-containing protein [Bryobacterales bacterium]
MPANDRFEFRIPFKTLLIGVCLTAVPISVAALYSILQSDRSLERTIGHHFHLIAAGTASEIRHVIQDRVVDVGKLTIAPDVVAAVETSNRSYQGMSEQAISDRISRIDGIWDTPEADPIVNRMLASPASRLLLQHKARDPSLLRITVTDEKGATVAASHKTLDYYQADEDYWQDIYAKGRGSVSVSDVKYDDVTHSYYVGVGVPILEEGTTRVIGTLDALVDLSKLFPVVSRSRIGQTGRTLLIKDDGTIIAAPDADLAMKARAIEAGAATEAINDPEGLRTGYVVTDLPGVRRTLIGFADVGLRTELPKLEWLVLVSQSTREAFAPIRVVGRLIAFVSVVSLGLVVLLIVYFTLHRREEFTEIGEIQPREPETVKQA